MGLLESKGNKRHHRFRRRRLLAGSGSSLCRQWQRHARFVGRKPPRSVAGCFPMWGPPSQWKMGNFSRRATTPQFGQRLPGARVEPFRPRRTHPPARPQQHCVRFRRNKGGAEASLSREASLYITSPAFANLAQSGIGGIRVLRPGSTTAAALVGVRPRPCSNSKSQAFRQKSLPRPLRPREQRLGQLVNATDEGAPATRSRIGAFRAESTRFMPGRFGRLQVLAPAAWSSSPWHPART